MGAGLTIINESKAAKNGDNLARGDLGQLAHVTRRRSQSP
jgi:hypothetical protein